jgi:hypothetical protein
MDDADIPSLQAGIREQHGCESTWIESVHVDERFRISQLLAIDWFRDVQVFELIGHPQAKHAYVWSDSNDFAGRQVTAVLELGPVTDAISAVRATIAPTR